jgi:hypothetical protein
MRPMVVALLLAFAMARPASLLAACDDTCMPSSLAPLRGLVVSDLPMLPVRDAPGYALMVAEAVMRATPVQDPPYLFLLTSRRSERVIRRAISQWPGLDRHRRTLWQRRVVRLAVSDSSRMTWLEDPIEFFSSPGNGLVMETMVREGDEKSNLAGLDQTMMQLGPYLQEIGIRQGRTRLPESIAKRVESRGIEGGNWEQIGPFTLLGSLGSDLHTLQRVVRTYCRRGKVLPIDTDWLEVGHTDEILKLLDYRPPGTGRQCSAKVLIASPSTGLEAIMATKVGSTLFEQPPRTSVSCPKEEPGCLEGSQLGVVCHLISGASAKSRRLGVVPECRGLAVKGLKEFILGSHLYQYNLAAEKRLNQVRSSLQSSFDRLGCQVEFVEAPSLYFNEELLERDFSRISEQRRLTLGQGKRGSDRPKKIPEFFRPEDLSVFRAIDLFPNMVNAIRVNDTLLSPHPFLKPFSQRFRQVLAPIRVEFIDTFHVGHVGQGGLHCMTKEIRTCAGSK